MHCLEIDNLNGFSISEATVGHKFSTTTKSTVFTVKECKNETIFGMNMNERNKLL